MGRKMRTEATSRKKPTIRRNMETGETFAEIDVTEGDDYRIPQEDDTGNVPEFVNISSKKQNVCVPWNSDSTIPVEPLHILKGEQWRQSLTQVAPAWGRFPPFIERVRNKDGEYDKRYLLEEKQVINLINSYGVRESVKPLLNRLMDNAQLVWNGDVMKKSMDDTRIDVREPEDRKDVIIAVQKLLRKIDDFLAEQKRIKSKL
ncbi:MAG TPA: hypothetical protein VMW36_01210 [Patescibacteria group bacterium]|nr:hypothetical protein [Patescibacteria group bacterium]